MAFLRGLSSLQRFAAASSLLRAARVLKKPSSSSLGTGAQKGKRWVQHLDTALLSPFLPALCCTPTAPLPLAGGLMPLQGYSLPQPGALLSPLMPICSSWLPLPKPEEEIPLRRGEGQQSIPAHGTVQGLGNYWDGPGADPQLLQHQPFPDAGGEGVRSPQWTGQNDLPSCVSLVNRNEPKLMAGIISQLFTAVSDYQAAYSCCLSQSPALATALPAD